MNKREQQQTAQASGLAVAAADGAWSPRRASPALPAHEFRGRALILEDNPLLHLHAAQAAAALGFSIEAPAGAAVCCW